MVGKQTKMTDWMDRAGETDLWIPVRKKVVEELWMDEMANQ